MPLSHANITASLRTKKNEKTGLFRGIKEDIFQEILSHSIANSYKSGQIIIRQGDTPEYLYVLTSGRAKAVRNSAEGNESTLQMLTVGDTCMETPIFISCNSPVTLQTTEDSEFILIPRNFIKNLVLTNVQFANNILEIVSYNYDESIHQVDSIVTKTPIQRVGYYFLQKHIEQDANNMDFELPYKKSTIANYLGITPETFSRAQAQIKKMGVKIDGEKIKLEDAFALCHFCDIDLAHKCNNNNKEDCYNCPLHN